jgi:hypothetical protein
LKDEKESSAAKMFFDRDTNRGAREENHGPGKSFKRTVAVCNAEAGDIMDRLILELDTSAAVEDRIAKGNILRPIEWFEDTIQEVCR